MSRELSEQEEVRRDNLEKIREMGIEPYPAEPFPLNAWSTQILEDFEAGKEPGEVVIAGRLMSRRIMGKASFAELQDVAGRIQIYLNRDELCPGEDKALYNTLFKKLLDIGDHIGVKGTVFKTKVGQVTVHVKELKLLCKSLRPLPIVKRDQEGEAHDTFSDPDQRYRQRYVDLVVNPGVKETFRQRTRLIQSMRDHLIDLDYLEVETPILQPIYGGAAARPFKTHHHALDTTLYLRIANELYLKRLIVGGFYGVFEFAKDFRNEGMSRFHNPEFTQLELYVAYKDYEWMMGLTEEMLEKAAIALHGDTKVAVGNHVIDFQRPWQRYTLFGAIYEFTGVDVPQLDHQQLLEAARDLGVEVDESMERGAVIDEIFGEKVEPKLIQPTFLTDYPIEMSPLAKKHRSKAGVVERFEVVCNGKEICNAFSELNDPIDQRKRFEEQLEMGERGDEEAMALDEDFLRAIEYGMPPTAGLGVGIDRLAMILTDSQSIQEVLFFPQMRPETQETRAEVEDKE